MLEWKISYTLKRTHFSHDCMMIFKVMKSRRGMPKRVSQYLTSCSLQFHRVLCPSPTQLNLNKNMRLRPKQLSPAWFPTRKRAIQNRLNWVEQGLMISANHLNNLPHCPSQVKLQRVEKASI